MSRLQTVFPTLRYRDVERGVEWLRTALGFAVHALHHDAGELAHAELSFGGDIVMLGPKREGGPAVGPAWTYVVDAEVDRRFEMATAADAEVVHPLADHDYGSREFTVRDPEGHLWSFGTYRPDPGPGQGAGA